MKKFAIAALALVMITAMLTGCGCTNSAAPTESTVMPTIMPSTQATRPTESMPTESSTPTGSQSGTDATGSNGGGTGESGNAGGSGNMGGSGSAGGSGSGMESGATETTEPLTSESGKVRSHLNGNF